MQPPRRDHPLDDVRVRATRLGLGLAALGRPGYINVAHGADLAGALAPEAMEARAHAVLDAAWSAGVRYLDAARSYGRAEEFLASWVRERSLGPGDVIVGSKWGYTYTAGWRVDATTHEVKEHSVPALRRQAGESRSLLGAHLALYQIHSATRESGVLENDAVLDELARLRDTGLAIGLSVSGAEQGEVIARAITITRGGAPLFVTVQATWNLLERAAGDALREAHEAGMGVIVKEALANGRLVPRADAGIDPRLAPLVAEAERLGVCADALALRAVLAEPWADMVLSGAATVEQLRANVRATAVPWSAETADRLGAMREDSRAYWRTRSALPWN